MTWLPSFVKLFLIFVAGFMLMFGSTVMSMEYLGNYTVPSIFSILRLIGLAIVLVSPVLIALKFFAQLDRKNQ
jgi:cytochrome c biogenesis protein CcdA